MKCVPRRRADDIIAMNETARFTDCTSTRNDSLPKLILQYSYLYTTTIHSWGQARFLFFLISSLFILNKKKTEKPLTCGGRVNVSNLRGYLRSFGYPEYYHGATLCRWTLRAAAGRRIRFQLLDLSIAGDRTRPFYFF